MTQLSIDASIQRFGENEARVNKFVNEFGEYSTNTAPSTLVETLPSFMERMQNRYLSFSVKGEWATATVYEKQDLFDKDGIVYIVLQDHTSGTFSVDLSNKKFTAYQGVSEYDLWEGEASDLIAFMQQGSESVKRSLFDKSKDIYSIFDWMTLTEKNDVKNFAFLADVSPAFARADRDLSSISNAAIELPCGGYNAGIAVRRSNFSIFSKGQAIIKLPNWRINISTVVRTSNVLSVTLSDTHNFWVGKGVKLHGVSNSSFNYGYIISEILSPYAFKCFSLNESKSNASSSGGYVTEAVALDIGEITHGNDANEYTNVHLFGLLIDGNRSARDTPSSDLTDWGLAMTKASKCSIDVKAVNCWQGGIGAFINSNYNHFKAYVENSGFSAQSPAGFDVNSSKFSTFDVVSKSCNYGARILDNCVGNVGKFAINNATVTGFVYGNQSVNLSDCNVFDVAIYGGCSAAGAQIGNNSRSSLLRIVAQGVSGHAVQEVGAVDGIPESNAPTGNVYHIATKGSGLCSCRIAGNGNLWTISSYLDGRTGAQGSNFAIDVYGKNNLIDAILQDSSTWQVRGVAFRAESSGNQLTNYLCTNSAEPYNDAGSNNKYWNYIPAQWTAPSFQNGFNNGFGAPYAAAGYLKDGRGQVTIRGSIGTGSLNTVAFTLPSGARPSARLVFPCVSNGGAGAIEVRENGEVVPIVGSSTWTISGISFLTSV